MGGVGGTNVVQVLGNFIPQSARVNMGVATPFQETGEYDDGTIIKWPRPDNLGGLHPKIRAWRKLEKCIILCLKHAKDVTRGTLEWTLDYPSESLLLLKPTKLYPQGITYEYTFNSPCWGATDADGFNNGDYFFGEVDGTTTESCDYIRGIGQIELEDEDIVGHDEAGPTHGSLRVPNPCDAPCGPGSWQINRVTGVTVIEPECIRY